MSTPRSPAGIRKDPLWNFKLVGAFMPRATAKACEKHGFHAAEIILNWPAIVGADIAAFTAPRLSALSRVRLKSGWRAGGRTRFPT